MGLSPTTGGYMLTFMIFWVPVCRGKVYVVPGPFPNHQNKKQENTDQVFIKYMKFINFPLLQIFQVFLYNANQDWLKFLTYYLKE